MTLPWAVNRGRIINGARENVAWAVSDQADGGRTIAGPHCERRICTADRGGRKRHVSMGGVGSGRARTHHFRNVEDVFALDIRRLNQLNALRPHQMGPVPITCRNGEARHINVTGDPSGNVIWLANPRPGASSPIAFVERQ